MTNDPRLLPRLAAIVAVVFFSTGGLAIKSVALPPLAISGSRSAIAAVCLGLYILLALKQRIRFDLGRSGWAAAICYFLSLTAYVIANKWTTAANTIFLQYTMPAWVLIFGALWLGERATWGRIISVTLSLGGLAVFFLEDVEPQQWAGNMTAVFAGVTFAFVVLTLRRNRERGAIHVVFWGNVITAACLLPVLFFDPALSFAEFNASALMGLVWLGVFQVAGAYVIYVWSLSRLPAIEVAILSLVEPLLNPIWVFWMIGEAPSSYAMVGGSIILTVVFLRSLWPEKSAAPA
ncbi:MAG: DMT family transporter [Candidatus Hinthialibacter antarcticus]|nr:DMT family transporter [Candidatus Hinthialibacter antarcticus]